MGNVDVSTASRIDPPSVNMKTVVIHMQLTLRKKLMNMSQTVKLMMRVHQMRKIRSSLMTLILIELFNNCILIFNGRMGVSKIESTSSPIKHHYEVTTTSEDLIGRPHHPRGSCQHLCAQGAKPPDD